MQLRRRDGNQLTHPAVLVHAKDREAGAAVWASVAAGDAPAAVQIGFDRAAITRLQSVRAVAGVDDLHAKLVPEDAGVREEGLAASKRVQIGATHTNPMNTHEREPLRDLRIGG